MSSINTYFNSSTHQSNLALSREVGTKLENTENALRSAIQGGKEGEILAAQEDHNKAKEMYTLLMNLLKSAHETMMAAINNIGR